MKIATLTYQRHDNIGAMLQCYALQKTIKQTGADNEIIDYICDAADRPFGMASLKVKGIKKYFTSIIGVISRIPKQPAFHRFRKEKLILSKKYDKNNIKGIDGKYDGYIVGSDNVWNSKLTGLDKNYFLDFVTDNDKKVSYAASLGLAEPPINERKQFSEALKGFAIVSTREEATAKNLQAISGRYVFDTCDPTFFLKQEEWNELAIEPREDYRYVLAYHMSPSISFVKFVKEFAKRKKLRIIYVPFPYGLCRCRIKPHIGPREWLGYVKNAEYVVTDSFHGCVFSTIYERNLIIKVSQLGERIKNLTSKLGISERMVNSVDEANDLPAIDYTDVRVKLDNYRTIGLSNLNDILLHFKSLNSGE